MTLVPPKIAVLMATYNGAEFIHQQLDSLAAQTHENWQLWVSDDGSTDDTLDILHGFQKAWGADKLRLLAGPRRGFQANFLQLTAQPDIRADYYAWSDQDDVWLPEKLARALEHLKPFGFESPVLYCGRTILTDRHGRPSGLSPLFNRRPPSFANALVQCLAGGNTMLFNQAARELIVLGRNLEVYSHDWWAYQVVSGAGRVVFHLEPFVRYRQHGANLMGGNRGLAARCSRLVRLMKGGFRDYVSRNINGLQEVRNRLAPDSRHLLEYFVDLRRVRNPLKRLSRFRAAGFHRQTGLEQAAIYLAVLLGKI